MEPQAIPMPLSFQRNGRLSQEESICDVDEQSDFSSVALRKTRAMTVQEDRFALKDQVSNAPFRAFYAVFDGHAGHKASQFCKDHIESHLRKIEGHSSMSK